MLDAVVAAGGQGSVLFWDRRTRRPLAEFDDTHMDDVTQVGMGEGQVGGEELRSCCWWWWCRRDEKSGGQRAAAHTNTRR